QRIDHGIFGYPMEPPQLRGIIVDRLKRRYDWAIQPEWIAFIPNVFAGFHLAAHAVARPGDGVLLTPPVYFPMLLVPKNVDLKGQLVELVCAEDGTYSIPYARFEAAVTGRSELFILCNPHNPIGKVYAREELEQIAEICLKHDLIICSDEIHSDFIYDGRKHVPIASLSREIADRTITVMSPVKSFNVAGIPFAFAVISNPGLREQYQNAGKGLIIHPSAMGFVAAMAAFEHGDGWSDDLVNVLQANREFAVQFIESEIPGIKMTPMEGTYLAWLDCRNARIEGSPYEFFLKEARVAVVDGARFGPGGEGFVRLNIACPRSRLQEGLTRIRNALM
ncbi:MAG: PatB family C-S lyase, partial [Candidatus Bipolaricaulota bacterium]